MLAGDGGRESGQEKLPSPWLLPISITLFCFFLVLSGLPASAGLSVSYWGVDLLFNISDSIRKQRSGGGWVSHD